MPTIRIVGDNTIEFVDSSGNVAAREQYDEGTSQLSFEDADGNPMPIALGDTEVSGSLSTDDVRPKRIAGNHHYAAEYDGTDADSRLDAALTASAGGDTIYLESETYTADRTINKEISIIGTEPSTTFAGSRIQGSWTISSRSRISQVAIEADLAVTSDRVTISDSTGGGAITITISGDRCLINNLNSTLTLLLESGTSGCLVDSSTAITVTDNGTNTVGDIA